MESRSGVQVYFCPVGQDHFVFGSQGDGEGVVRDVLGCGVLRVVDQGVGFVFDLEGAVNHDVFPLTGV